MNEPEQTGAGKYILTSKCDIDWTDRHCPNPVSCARYHFGQFGHKVIFLFCDECWAKPDPLPSLRNIEWFEQSRDEPSLPLPSRSDSLTDGEYFERYTVEEAEKYHKEWNNLIRQDDGILPKGAGLEKGRR